MGRVAALIVAIGMMASANPARAIDIDLPGERQLQIHGFYEMRLRFHGEDLPFGGNGNTPVSQTFSMFRHVLDIETEIDLFPEGWGPFDTMFMFTRWLFRYECIYRRSCGVFGSSDSYGGKRRKLVRMPKNLKPARVPGLEAGAVFPLRFRPGSLQPINERLNPNFRYRTCDNAPDQRGNPSILLGALCNLNQRSRTPLDGPIDEFKGVQSKIVTRAGAFNRDLRSNLLTAARPDIGDDRFDELQGLLVDGEFLGSGSLGVFRALSSAAARARDAGDTAEAEELQAEANALVDGTFDTQENTAVLLASRADANLFEVLAGNTNPGLLTAQWGASQLKDFVLPYLASLDTPIKPLGYFTGQAQNLVSPFGARLATDIFKVSGTGALPSNLARRATVPFLVGPDGIRNTADDLPIFDPAMGMRAVPAGPAGGGNPFPDTDYTDVIVVDQAGTDVRFFGRLRDDIIVQIGCNDLGGTIDPGTGACIPPADSDLMGDAFEEQVFKVGCRSQTGEFAEGGIDSEGKCIRLGVFFTVPFAGVPLFGDLDFRPPDANLEPPNLTDFALFAKSEGRGIPARPRSPDGGLYYKTSGVDRLLTSSSSLVSNLDLKFGEDRLAWGRGASDDEREFKEGYLEFEMLDGTLYSRVGKLILVWGKTELFRNQDRNNPLNISDGVITNLEESRIGQWMVDFVISPEAWMRLGPVEDLRLELAVIFDEFEPTDLGPCGENSSVALVCLKTFGAMASGLVGLGLVGEVRPSSEYSGLKEFDYGVRIEGRMDRFTFAITNFWGWDDQAYPDLVFQYSRSADPGTGAPINFVGSGAKSCTIRMVDGRPAGPDGDPDTPGDNNIPSVGNCLLFDNPKSPTAVQTLRDSDVIALNHYANQTLFHTVCTLSFDPDQGFCPLDQLNAPGFFGIVSNLVAGGEISSFASDGLRFIRTPAAPFDGVLPEPETRTAIFKKVAEFDLSNLTQSQKALLGCGDSFVNPCGDGDMKRYLDDPALQAILGGRGAEQLSGGVDLMNADGSVVTQEFTLLKEAGTGQLVGVRNVGTSASQFFEPGISSGGLTVDETIALGDVGRTAFTGRNNTTQVKNKQMSDIRTTVIVANPGAPLEEINDILLMIPAYEPTFDASPGAIPIGGGKVDAIQPIATDSWVEGLPWVADPDLLAEGILLYQVANQNQRDPRCTFQEDHADLFDPDNPACFDDQGNRLNRPFNDPTDPTNPLNVFRTDSDDSDIIFGESCIQNFGDTPRFLSGQRALAFDSGCTDLEKFSANFERLTMAFEIIGNDRVPDPPETFEELINVLADDRTLLPGGDPIAGPDGIFVANLASGLGNLIDPGRFETGEKEMQVARIEVNPVTAGIGLVKLDDFTGSPVPLEATESARIAAAMGNFLLGGDGIAAYDPDSCLQEICHLVIGEDSQVNAVDAVEVQASGPKEVVSVLPIALELTFVEIDDLGNPVGGGIQHFNMAVLNIDDPIAFQELLDPEHRDPTAPPGLEGTVEVEIDGQIFRLFPTTSIRERFLGQGNDGVDCQDLDNDGICDFDQEGDGVWDGADDYSRGPATDDNILCGSGLPGDILQDALQFEFARPSDDMLLEEAFPEGLPARSPVFCRSAVGLLGATGLTLPIRRAGGDTSYGRRDFLWHAGRQITLSYQKRNVFGFALDFAEDVTKTSWGIEFTWTANKYFPNLNTFSGLNQSDEAVLSVSIDRPTFINYLNPNRSFFLNFQFFIRYLSDYTGGSDDKDGSFAVAQGPLDTRVVFTFFTGYFQDRLQPRATFIYDPLTSNGGVLSRLQYRWTEAFSTTVGYNTFFGHQVQQRQAIYPISLRTATSDLTAQAFARSLNPVHDEDFAFITVRFSF